MKHLFVVLNFLFVCFIQFTYGQIDDKKYQEGINYFSNENYEEALGCFKKVYKKYPTNEIKFWIAHSYAHLNDVNHAKSLFLEIIYANPRDLEYSMSLLNLGTCYRNLKQYDSAYYYYETTIKLFPKYSDAYFMLGQLYFSESKFDEAKENYNKAIMIDSTNSRYYEQRMYTCFATLDYNCALNDMLIIKKMIPNADLETNIAYCYTMMNRYKEADSVYKLIFDANSSLFLNNYGYNKYLLGDTLIGKELIMKSLQIDPSNSFVYRNLALIAILEKDEMKICEYLNKARSLGFEKYYGNEVNDLIEKYCNK